MPNITVELFTGRTLEQKRVFVAAVTNSAVEILKVKPEAVRIRLVEMETWDLANGGELESDRRAVDVPEGVRTGRSEPPLHRRERP
ncbi:MAG: tautomerase family protein [Candidatus Limnocylindrales bacterium]